MALLAPRKNDDDLFNETTMSFGEHLEDLRGSLFRAVIGLVIGFCIGLAVGKPAVNLIQRPLENALRSYYTELTIERVEEDLKNQQSILAERGVHYDVKVLREMISQGMIFETKYVDVTELKNAIAGGTSNQNNGSAAPASTPPAAPSDALPSTELPPSSVGPTEDVSKSKTPVTVNDTALSNLVPLLVWQTQKDDDRTKASTLSAQEGFMIWIKASFVVGALISAPWVFYQIWMFVAAGLYRHERSYVYTFLPFSLGLFFLGAATAYLFVFEPVLQFLFDFNKWLGMHPDPRMNEWIGFVLLLPLGFGISFQLPLVMLFLERIGVLTAKDFIEKWRIAVLAIFVISAVLTPADPYSIFFMAVPLTFLYFGGILMMIYLPKSSRPAPA